MTAELPEPLLAALDRFLDVNEDGVGEGVIDGELQSGNYVSETTASLMVSHGLAWWKYRRTRNGHTEWAISLTRKGARLNVKRAVSRKR